MDCGASLRLGGTVSDSILGGGGGGTRHLFLLTLDNSKNIRGARAPGHPCSAVPDVNVLFSPESNDSARVDFSQDDSSQP